MLIAIIGFALGVSTIIAVIFIAERFEKRRLLMLRDFYED